MDNNISISYYESMIDLVSENRKITEVILGSNMHHFVNESDIIYENKVTTAVLKFIKDIFDRIVGYLKKITEYLNNKDNFKSKRIIVKACKTRMESMSSEDKDNFIIKDINFTDALIENIDDILHMVSSVDKDLKVVMDDFDNLFSRLKTNVSILENIKSDIAEYNERLVKKSSVENIKDKAKDVTFESLADILEDYESSKMIIKNIKGSNDDILRKMDGYKRRIERASISNVIEDKLFDYIPKYREVIYAATTFIASAMKSVLDLTIYDFRNQENILKIFISYSTKERD